jgi:hypothetical protein
MTYETLLFGIENGVAPGLRTEFKRSSSMSWQRSVVFAGPVRAAIGAFGGALKDIPAPDLGAA